ncbi:MAG: imidazolonepropionase, partial [Ilumatobacteraceae bacterium]
MTLLVDGIARLVTNGPDDGLGDAWIVVDGEHVVAVGAGSPPAADERLDVGGRCVLPGFVDSHTHL